MDLLVSGIRLHERERLTLAATADLREAVVLWLAEHDLTEIEINAIFLGVLVDEVARYFKYELRMERHGTYDKAGGEA